jgi:hypothetical protein
LSALCLMYNWQIFSPTLFFLIAWVYLSIGSTLL